MFAACAGVLFGIVSQNCFMTFISSNFVRLAQMVWWIQTFQLHRATGSARCLSVHGEAERCIVCVSECCLSLSLCHFRQGVLDHCAACQQANYLCRPDKWKDSHFAECGWGYVAIDDLILSPAAGQLSDHATSRPCWQTGPFPWRPLLADDSPSPHPPSGVVWSRFSLLPHPLILRAI